MGSGIRDTRQFRLVQERTLSNRLGEMQSNNQTINHARDRTIDVTLVGTVGMMQDNECGASLQAYLCKYDDDEWVHLKYICSPR